MATKDERLAAMNRAYQRDPAFSHLRVNSKFVTGNGPANAKVLVLGEAPGRTEDMEGVPFVGRAGALLNRMLSEYAGVERQRAYVTNVLKYRPPHNRDPEPEEVFAARRYIGQEIVTIGAQVNVLCGRFAYQLVFGGEASITADHGKERELKGRLYLPVYHPAVALYNPLMLEDLRKDFAALKRVLLGEEAEDAAVEA